MLPQTLFHLLKRSNVPFYGVGVRQIRKSLGLNGHLYVKINSVGGGLRLKDIEKFNIALLRKWLWRICSKKEQLWK